MNAIREESELPNIEKKLIECSDDITELFNMLMTLEMQLVEQLEVKPDWRRRRGLSMQLQSLTSMLLQALPLYVQCNPVDMQEKTGQIETGGSLGLPGQ